LEIFTIIHCINNYLRGQTMKSLKTIAFSSLLLFFSSSVSIAGEKKFMIDVPDDSLIKRIAAENKHDPKNTAPAILRGEVKWDDEYLKPYLTISNTLAYETNAHSLIENIYANNNEYDQYNPDTLDLTGDNHEDISTELMEGNKSVFLKHNEIKGLKGLIIALHGFSAGTWQFEHIAPQLAEIGYDVYVPRLPGHGFKNNKGYPTERFIVSTEYDVNYEQYINFTQVDLSIVIYDFKNTYPELPVHVIGMSFGGALGYELSKIDEVNKAILIDPFFAPVGMAHTLAQFVDATHSFSPYLANLIAGLTPASFKSEEEKFNEWGRSGHFNFTFQNIMPLYLFGNYTLSDNIDYENAGSESLQLTKTLFEPNVSNTEKMVQAVTLSKNSNTCLYTFSKDSQVMHSPFHYKDTKDEKARAVVRKMIIDVLENDKIYCDPYIE
jgi:esterase/lipase